MFPDNFIELMGIEDHRLIDVVTGSAERPGGFRFGRFFADFLDSREGIAMVALHSKDARADLATVEARGVPSAALVDFRRAVRLPDGRTGEAVVTLAMLIAISRLAFGCAKNDPEHLYRARAWAVKQIVVAASTKRIG